MTRALCSISRCRVLRERAFRRLGRFSFVFGGGGDRRRQHRGGVGQVTKNEFRPVRLPVYATTAKGGGSRGQTALHDHLPRACKVPPPNMLRAYWQKLPQFVFRDLTPPPRPPAATPPPLRTARRGPR